MKIKILGWRDEEISIVNRLEKGFEELGHEIVVFDNKPDLLIAINPDVYDEAIKHEMLTGGLKIFNILDVPEHLIDTYPVEEIKDQLKHADVITCISESTKKQVKKYFKKKAHVVYTPSLEVENVPKTRDVDFLYVGRAGDPNKRFSLVLQSLRDAGMPHNSLHVCGPEPTSHGVYHGVVTASKLNELYHQTKAVLLPSKVEGIGLSMIEGAMAGAVPITCTDNPTAKEFGFEEFSVEPSIDSYSRAMMMTMMDYIGKKQRVLEIVQKQNLFNKFNKKTVAKKYIDFYEDRFNSIGI